MDISCREPDWQLSSIEQVSNTSLHPLSTVKKLCIEPECSNVNTLWLQLFLPFTAVINLYLSKEIAPGIVAALQELVGDRILRGSLLPDSTPITLSPSPTGQIRILAPGRDSNASSGCEGGGTAPWEVTSNVE